MPQVPPSKDKSISSVFVAHCWRHTHPRQLFQQKLGETHGGSSHLRGAVVDHVEVQEGQLHQVLGQSVLLIVGLAETNASHRSVLVQSQLCNRVAGVAFDLHHFTSDLSLN